MTDDELDEVAAGMARRKNQKQRVRALQKKTVRTLLKDAGTTRLEIVDLGAVPKSDYDHAGWREFVVGVRVMVPPVDHKEYRYKEGDKPTLGQLQRVYIDDSSWMWPYAVSSLQEKFRSDEEQGE